MPLSCEPDDGVGCDVLEAMVSEAMTDGFDRGDGASNADAEGG